MNCPFCNSMHCTSYQGSKTFRYGIENPVTLQATVPIRRCSNCKAEWTDNEADDIIEGVIKKHIEDTASGRFTP